MPRPLSPGQGSSAELPLELTWTECVDVDYYQIQLDTTSEFGQPVVDTVANLAHLTLSLDLPSGRYYWRLAQVTVAGAHSEFSTAVSFRIEGWSYPRSVVATIPLGAHPGALAVRPDGREVWVGSTSQDDRHLYVVCTDSLVVSHQVTSEGYAHGEVVFDPAGTHAFTCMMLDPGNREGGEIEGFSTSEYVMDGRYYYTCGGGCHSWPWGYGLCSDPRGEYLYAIDGEYGEPISLGVTNNGMHHADPIGAVDVSVSPNLARAYACGPTGSFVEYDVNDMDSTRGILIDASLGPLVITGDGRYAFISQEQPPGFSVVDLTTFEVVAYREMPTGFAWARPFALALSPDERFLFLCDRESAYVHVADVTNPTHPAILEHLQIGGNAVHGVAFAPDGSRAYLSVEPTGLVMLER